MNLTDLLAIGEFVVLICTIVGGWFAIRSAVTKSALDVSVRVREDLAAENRLLQDKIERLEKDNKRLQQIVYTIRHALKRRGLHIEIEGEYITVVDANGQADSTRFSGQAKTPIAKVAPVKLQPIQDDDDTTA